MRIARWLLKALGIGVAGIALGLGVWALLPASTAPIEGANAIAALERVTLGGAEQTVLLRGRDRALPVLLWIHGGPGFAQLPIAAPSSALLEQHFVVVSWDQRGAGASCDGTDFETLTQEQIVATGLLRNSMVNEEGGIDPEQFRMEALFDRMDAIGKGVLGLTIQCAQCHNHKFDPVSQEDYYRLFAFLNNDDEPTGAGALGSGLDFGATMAGASSGMGAGIGRGFPSGVPNRLLLA